MKRLAIITTHPIQYYAPLFKLLAERKIITVKVFYTWGIDANGKLFDPGFGNIREWDVPLLEGYAYEFVKNVSSKAGSHHFRGIINPGLIKRINEWSATAVLVIGWKFISHLEVMYHFKGKLPVLFYGDSTLLDEPSGFSVKKIIRRAALYLIYRYIDYALYPGTNTKAYFSSNGVGSHKLIYAPHAIDNMRFMFPLTQHNEAALQWKKELNIPLDKPAVLFAGKLEPKKNPLFLLEAATSFPALHFIIAGNGVLGSKINEQAKYMENITLLPFQNQSKMPALYRLADIFILPSKGPGETWGLALNEAMACGRIVIATNKCGGAIDLIKNNENGFIIEPVYEALGEVLNTLIARRMNWDDMKKRSSEFIQNFALDKLCMSIEDILKDKVAA